MTPENLDDHQMNAVLAVKLVQHSANVDFGDAMKMTKALIPEARKHLQTISIATLGVRMDWVRGGPALCNHAGGGCDCEEH
jgi:hypothetical protein